MSVALPKRCSDSDDLASTGTLGDLRRCSKRKKPIQLMGTSALFYNRLVDLFFAEAPSPTIRLKGAIPANKICFQLLHSDPPIYVADGILLPGELEYFELMAKTANFERSFVDNHSGDTIIDDYHRTSSFFGFQKNENPKIRSFQRRIADLFCCAEDQIEPIQLVRYKPGEFFGLHHDMGDLSPDGDVVLPQRVWYAKRRLITLFIYLNTLPEEQGGCTHFPRCDDLRINPKRGRLVMWSNVTKEGLPDPRTVHAGECVSNPHSPAKYGLNVWICEE